MTNSDLIVIGICGRARSGKDTAASALALHRGCYRLSLANPIKSLLTPELIKELTPDHPYRKAMQLLGTESRDAVNAPGLWVHLLLATMHYLAFLHPVSRRRFVIPDIRFRHEEGMIRQQVSGYAGGWGGRFGLLKLVRPGVEIGESNHKSETEVDLVRSSLTYTNDGSIDDLIISVLNLFDGKPIVSREV